MLLRPTGPRGGLSDVRLQPGDILATGESIGALTTAGSGTLTGALIANGIVARTGPAGAYTDTTDTAWNIIQALAGNFPAADTVQGIAFRFLFMNQVAQAMTFAGGAGVIAGSNVNVAASAIREYLVTILNSSPPVTTNCGTTNGNKVITLDSPIQTGTFDLSGTKGFGTITPGMIVSGTGIAANTRVVGLTFGDQTKGLNANWITGVTTDTNSTATNASGIPLTFNPCVRFDGLRAGTA